MNPSLRNLDAPDAVAWLNEVKEYLKDDHASFCDFRRRVTVLLGCRSYQATFHEAVVAIANILRAHPQLFRGLNSVLRNGDRIECPGNNNDNNNGESQVVGLFVLVAAGSFARILCSTSLVLVPDGQPSNTTQLLDVVASKEAWTRLVAGGYSVDYLTCLSQLLQVLLDDRNTESRDKATIYRCLRDLGDVHAILPPSIFLNHIKHREGGQGPQLHAKQGGASSDIFMSVIKGMPTCFRVLRMFDVPQDERDKLYKKFCKEVLVWRQLKHPNVLPLLGANTESFRPQFCFISYWMNNGNIMSYLKKNPGHDRLAAVNDIVAGIDYLHHLDPPVTHNDLKGANVLVTDALSCCLADFGLSSILESQRLGNKSPTLAGSICWMAPELMTAGEPDSGDPSLLEQQVPVPRTIDRKAGDIFALGCTIYEIYTGKPPHYNCPNLANVIYAVSIEKKRPTLPPPDRGWTDAELDMWWVVDQCWAHEPNARPEIHLVKANFESLTVKKERSVDRNTPNSPWPILGGDQDLVSASELANVQHWLQMEESVTKDQAQFNVTPSLKRPRTSVLAPIQVEVHAPILVRERYPTPVSPVARDRRHNPSTDTVKSDSPANRLRVWTRIRPPSPHPRFMRTLQHTGLPTPPSTPNMGGARFSSTPPSTSPSSSPPPLPPAPPSGVNNCPLDLDVSVRRRTSSYPKGPAVAAGLRKPSNSLRSPGHSRWRNAILIESDYESGADSESAALQHSYAKLARPLISSLLR